MHKLVCLSVFVVVSTLLIGCQAQPVYTTYQQSVDMGAKLKTSANAAFPYYLHFYFTANDTTLYGAAVTNYTGWIGVGISYTGSMISGGYSDAIVTYYDSSAGKMYIKDLSLSAKTVGNQGNCLTSTGVCADEDKQNCFNNVELVDFKINGTYHMWQFTRPLAATDACDRAVPVGSNLGYVIAAAGLMGSGVALPYSMQQHGYRTPSGYSTSIPTGPIPLANGTTTTSTSTGTSTSGTTSTSAGTSTSSTSSTSGSTTSGTTGTTGTTGSTVTTGGSTTGSSGAIQCTKDISQQCLDECAPHFVDYCRCNITTNTLVYVCKDSFSAAMSYGTPAYWIAFILGLVALVLQ